MKFFPLIGGVLLASTLTAQAQNSSLPLWEIGAFGGLASTPAYPASTERSSRALVLPFLIYRGDVLRVDRTSIAARIAHTDDYEFDLGFAGSLPAKSDDIAARRGMPDLGTLVEFGPRLKMTLDRPTPTSRVRLEVPLRAVLEFNSGVRTQGMSFEPELVYEALDLSSGWRWSASGSLVLGDRKLNRYFYGVAPQYATAERPAYEAKAGLIATRLGLSTAKDITPDVRVFGFIRYELYDGAANRASPLFLQSHGASVGVGLTWTLGRSESRAAN
jgi:outer membrane scaffolding protein for murein synthesis (MipA/OmpV family)